MAGRPPLPRWRFELVVTVELGAPNFAEAAKRARAIGAELDARMLRRGRLERMAGAPLVLDVRADHAPRLASSWPGVGGFDAAASPDDAKARAARAPRARTS